MTEVTLLVYDGMWRSGGIQSIIIRLFEREQSNLLWVVCDSKKDSVGVPKDRILDVNASIGAALPQLMNEDPAKLNIIAFGPSAASIACLVEQNIRRRYPAVESKTVIVVLHPQEFMMKEEKRHVHYLNRLLALLVGPSRLVFMNGQCRESHSAFFSRDLSANAIVPVPIDRREARWTGHQESGALRIVAVGRIVDFKAYNFTLPRILTDLNHKGYKVTCDIFGYGAEEPKLVRTIQDAGAGHIVKFKGPIALEDFDSIVPNHDVFIGMGTAAVQAAQLGVPTILAIADDGNGAHGFIHEAPFGNLGEQDNRVPRQDLGAMLETYLQAGTVERQRISAAGIAYANRYVADNYVEQLIAHSVVRTGMSRYLAATYCRFYIWMAKDNWLRAVVRSVRLFARRGQPS
jgi:hypothetical protein